MNVAIMKVWCKAFLNGKVTQTKDKSFQFCFHFKSFKCKRDLLCIRFTKLLSFAKCLVDKSFGILKIPKWYAEALFFTLFLFPFFQVIKMLICVVILFLLCWGPRFIMELLMKMQFSWLYYEHVYIIRIVLFLLPMIHAILNPVVYFIMSNNFRNSVLARCTDCPPTCCRRHQAHGSFGDLGKYQK